MKNTGNKENKKNPKDDEKKLISLLKEMTNEEVTANFSARKQEELLKKILKELDL